MIVCLRAAAQALSSGGPNAFAKGSHRPSPRLARGDRSRSAGGFESASPMRLMIRRMIVSPTVWPETESATRRARRSQCASLRRPHQKQDPPAPQDARRRQAARRRGDVRLARSREAATDLETLRSIMAEFDGCALKRTATQLVFADGVPGSRVMFVGEAPGRMKTGSGARSLAERGNC